MLDPLLLQVLRMPAAPGHGQCSIPPHSQGPSSEMLEPLLLQVVLVPARPGLCNHLCFYPCSQCMQQSMQHILAHNITCTHPILPASCDLVCDDPKAMFLYDHNLPCPPCSTCKPVFPSHHHFDHNVRSPNLIAPLGPSSPD